ncbi:MAG: HAMP domain-containing sensor histidine kinase [Pseudomonadota bacterium]
MTNRDQVAALAHDIRNMLAPALLSAEYLSRDDKEFRQKHTNRIFFAIDRTVALCQVALDNATTQNAGGSVADISDTIREAVTLAVPNPSDTLRLECRHDGDRAIFVDHSAILRMIFNLVRNAHEAIGDGGVIGVKASARDGMLRMDIVDTGNGLPDHVVNDLFSCSYAPSRKRRRMGTGLPSTARSIKRLKGDFLLENTGPDGTHFSITLPYLKQL